MLKDYYRLTPEKKYGFRKIIPKLALSAFLLLSGLTEEKAQAQGWRIVTPEDQLTFIEDNLKTEAKKSYNREIKKLHEESQAYSLDVEINDLNRINKFFNPIGQEKRQNYFSFDKTKISIYGYQTFFSYRYQDLRNLIYHAVSTILSASYNMTEVANTKELLQIAKERSTLRQSGEIKQEMISKPGTLIPGFYEVKGVTVNIARISTLDDLRRFVNLFNLNIDFSKINSNELIVAYVVIEIVNKDSGEKLSISTFAPPQPIQLLDDQFLSIYSRYSSKSRSRHYVRDELNIPLSVLAAIDNALTVLEASKDPEYIKMQEEQLEIRRQKSREKLEKLKDRMQNRLPQRYPILGIGESRSRSLEINKK